MSGAGDETSANVWIVIERSVAELQNSDRAVQAPSAGEAEGQSETGSSKEVNRRVRRFKAVALDLISATAWTYWLVNMFFLDLKGILVRRIWPAQQWLIDYRIVMWASIAIVVGIVAWRRRYGLFVAYVLAFPFIVALWKIPQLIWQRRSWILAIAYVNAIAVVFRNLRYNIITKSLAVLLAIVVLFASGLILMIIAIIGLGGLLLASSIRTIRKSFEVSWFIDSQRRTIDWYVKSSLFRQMGEPNAELLAETRPLKRTELDTITSGMSVQMMSSRALYFWAYQLHQYSRRRLGVVFNSLSYMYLFVGSVAAIWLANLAVLRIDATQFDAAARPSNMAMLLYSLSSLLLNEGGGVSSVGDWAHLVRIVSGLYGILVLGFFLVNLIFTVRKERDEESLESTVDHLKAQARALDAQFHKNFAVDIDEARRRLASLGLGAFQLVEYLVAMVPRDFVDNGDLDGDEVRR